MANGYRHPGGAASRERVDIDNEQSGAFRASVRPGGVQWPQLRIGRQADFRETNGDAWNDYLNQVARANSHRGMTRPLGLVACHYVLDTEMRAMVADKYPTDARDLKRMKGIYRDIMKAINRHIGDVDYDYAKQLNTVEYRERPELMGVCLDTDSPIVPSQRWRDGFFELRPTTSTAFAGYDGNKVAVDLSANPEFADERNDILRFLRSETKLNTTRFVRADWEPHATIFQAHAPLGVPNATPVLPDGFPQDIALLAPKAHLYNA